MAYLHPQNRQAWKHVRIKTDFPEIIFQIPAEMLRDFQKMKRGCGTDGMRMLSGRCWKKLEDVGGKETEINSAASQKNPGEFNHIPRGSGISPKNEVILG